MEYVTLNNGVKMPLLGLGVYQIEAEKCEEIVYQAISYGYRLIDTAAAYGNEAAVGKAVKRSSVPREEVFITTKLWLTDATYEGTKQAFQRSLELLDLDYVDLYLIHQPYNDIYGAWRAMEELYREGKIKAIGVSNFSSIHLIDLINFNQITPTVNQVEVHPFLQRHEDQKIMAQKDIQLEAWSPFAKGQFDLFTNQLLQKIGDKYGKSIAQVVLRWQIQRGIVTIPKSANLDRMKENFEVFDFQLAEEDMEAIAALDQNQSIFFDQRDPAAVEQFLGMVRTTEELTAGRFE